MRSIQHSHSDLIQIQSTKVGDYTHQDMYQNDSLITIQDKKKSVHSDVKTSFQKESELLGCSDPSRLTIKLLNNH